MTAKPGREMADLKGRALVVGATGAIGAAVARVLAERGSRLIMTFRNNREGAESLLRDIEGFGGDAVVAHLDTSSAEACQALCERVGRKGIHTLVHAAGPVVPQQYLSEVSPNDYLSFLARDAAGFFNVAAAALPLLRASAGSIVAVTTVAAHRHPPRDGLSGIPKSAVEATIRGLASEEGRYGVRANAVAPGVLEDGMGGHLLDSETFGEAGRHAALRRTALRRFGAAVDVAEAVAYLASPNASYVTGQVLHVDGGFGI